MTSCCCSSTIQHHSKSSCFKGSHESKCSKTSSHNHSHSTNAGECCSTEENHVKSFCDSKAATGFEPSIHTHDLSKVKSCCDPSNKIGCCSSTETHQIKSSCESTSATGQDGGCCSKTSAHSNNQSIAKSCCDSSNMGGCCSSVATTHNAHHNHVSTKSCCDSSNKAACCSSTPAMGSDAKDCCNTKPSGECCSSSGTCSANENPQSALHCLAVVRPDNSNTIDVFDAHGKSRSFRSGHKYDGKLCFSTHGAGDGADGLLTPCFDENGNHGEPEEGCFCGLDEPHIHAHIYNPDRCDGEEKVSDADCSSKKKIAPNMGFLAQLTLLEVVEDHTTPLIGGSVELVNVPISETLPNECNSSDLNRYLSEKGFALSQWISWSRGVRRRSAVEVNDEESGNYDRLYPILHEDHTDYLVHNRTTNDLHLEHPCDSCGNNDIHGRFRLTHSRSWVNDGSAHQVTKAVHRKESQEIRLHFFEAHAEPFHLLDFLTDFFELESSRVHAARAADALVDAAAETSPLQGGGRIGRSHFFVEKICCASETHQINSIVKPLDGVVAVAVNTTNKLVYVDHDLEVISATEISDALNFERFGCHIRKDAAMTMAQMTGIPDDCFVFSTFEILDRDALSSVEGMLIAGIQKDQVKKISIDEPRNILQVQHNPYYLTAKAILELIRSKSIDANLVSDGDADGMWALKLTNEIAEDEIEYHGPKLRCNVILSGICWILSMFSYIEGNWEYLKYVALLSVAFGLPPIAVKAWRTLRRFHFDVNCMMLFATIGAIALLEFTEAGAVTFLFSISEYLESIATARARNALSAIVRLRPDRANVINPITKSIVVLPASAVPVGTLVSVKTGDKIPCDGCVVEGKSTVDESNLTGESAPVKKTIGSIVSGGTTNNGSTQLIVKTTATSDQSAVAKLIRLVEEAQANRSETEKLVDRFAAVYSPIVLLAALSMCTIPWAFGNETGRAWTMNGLIAIVIACPCALIISTPVTYVAALAAAAQRGIVVKGGAYLEAMGNVKEIAFDKTGTLTQGVFALVHFQTIGNRTRKEVLEYLALMESPASHPLADALVKGAANEKVDIPKHRTLKNHTLLPGEGITAVVDGKEVHVGNIRLFQRLGYHEKLSKTNRDTADEWAKSSGTVGFISIQGDGIVGMFCVSDKIRNESNSVIAALKKRGIKITMLTGDQSRAATGIGLTVGLDPEDIRSQLLPEDKVSFIAHAVDENRVNKQCWKSKRNVMMVGDGVNDAPALALADISVAMGEGAALAMEASDVTLMDSNLEKLLYIIHMGRRVIRTIIENVTFSLVTKAIVMGFAFAGRASLWAAIASDVGAMLLVTLNGMKLLPSSRKLRDNDLRVAEGRTDFSEP